MIQPETNQPTLDPAPDAQRPASGWRQDALFSLELVAVAVLFWVSLRPAVVSSSYPPRVWEWALGAACATGLSLIGSAGFKATLEAARRGEPRAHDWLRFLLHGALVVYGAWRFIHHLGALLAAVWPAGTLGPGG